jgi:hypothetical protein
VTDGALRRNDIAGRENRATNRFNYFPTLVGESVRRQRVQQEAELGKDFRDYGLGGIYKKSGESTAEFERFYDIHALVYYMTNL